MGNQAEQVGLRFLLTPCVHELNWQDNFMIVAWNVLYKL